MPHPRRRHHGPRPDCNPGRYTDNPAARAVGNGDQAPGRAPAFLYQTCSVSLPWSLDSRSPTWHHPKCIRGTHVDVAMDRVKEILSYFLAAMAMFSIICAIYEAMNQRVGSAITLGGLFLVTTLLFYIPQLETLKAFGVEARLNRSLDRAEEIIGRLKELSLINA